METAKRIADLLCEGSLDFSLENCLTFGACVTLLGYCVVVFTGRRL
jgi:hypothetical protein